MSRTDEDILRDLLQCATDDVRPPAGVAAAVVARHRRRLRNTRLLGAATAGVAAAAVAAAVLVTQGGPPATSQARPPAPLPTTARSATAQPAFELLAVQVLDRLSATAARAPEPAGRYVALPELRHDAGTTYQRTTVFDGVTGDVYTYQQGSGMPSELPVQGHFSPTRAEFAKWPTDPARLRAFLLSPAPRRTPEGAEAVEAGASPDDLVFDYATNWLWNPLLSPALRAALYKVLAATPGVTVKTHVTDMNGRPAVEISHLNNSNGVVSTTFQNPSTGTVLEQDFSDVGPSSYGPVTSSATLPPNPYRGG